MMPPERKFMMFFRLLCKMCVNPFFPKFQPAILNTLEVAPSQLTQNSWGYIRCFEHLLNCLKREVSLKAFLTIFEVLCRLEFTNGTFCFEFVSLKALPSYSYFEPLPQMKDWKFRYVYLVSKSVCSIDNTYDFDDGMRVGDAFSLGWCPSEMVAPLILIGLILRNITLRRLGL